MLRHPIFLWDLLGSLSPRPLLGEGALEDLEILEDLGVLGFLGFPKAS